MVRLTDTLMMAILAFQPAHAVVADGQPGIGDLSPRTTLVTVIREAREIVTKREPQANPTFQGHHTNNDKREPQFTRPVQTNAVEPCDPQEGVKERPHPPTHKPTGRSLPTAAI